MVSFQFAIFATLPYRVGKRFGELAIWVLPFSKSGKEREKTRKNSVSICLAMGLEFPYGHEYPFFRYPI